MNNFSQDRAVLEDFVNILKPFRIATKLVEGDNSTAGMVIPVIKLLQAQLSGLEETLSGHYLLKALSDAVKDRLVCYASEEVFILAAACDPRFKLNWCQGKLIIYIRSNCMNVLNGDVPCKPTYIYIVGLHCRAITVWCC